MANSGDIRAGRAFVELYADDSKLIRTLNAMSARLKNWGAAVTATGTKLLAAGTAAAAPFVAAAKLFASAGDKLHKMSQRTGIAAETLSQLSCAAELSGTDIDTLETAIRAMQRTIGDATTGTADLLASLGVNMEALKQMTPDQQLKTLADAIAQLNSPTEKTAVAMKLFGDSGTALLPLLANGAAGIEALQKQAADLGLTMTTDDANAAAALTDALTALFAVLKRTAIQIGAAVAPILKNFAATTAAVIAPIITWLNQNRALVTTLFAVAAGIAATGAALMALGQLITLTGTALSGIAAITAVIKAGLAAIPGIIALTLSPLGLLTTGLAAVAAYAITANKAWAPVMQWLADAFVWVSDIAIKAWRGISDALAAGDLQLAAQIALAGLQTAWFEALTWITSKWLDLKKTLITTWYNAIYGIAQLALTGFGKIRTLWVDLQAVFRTLWARTTKIIGDTWDALYYFLARSFTRLTHLFSSAADAAAARQALDDEQAARAKERERKTQEQLAAIERERAQQKDAINRNTADVLATLEEDKRRAIEGATGATDDSLDAMRKKAEDARKRFTDLTKKAAAAAAAAPSAPAPKQPDIPPPEAIEATTKKSISVMGTFSALAASRLGLASPMERTARATEEIAKNTKKLLQKQGATFI